MNGLDFAIIFAFLAIIGLGFFGGIVRVLAAIVAIYLASVISAAFYQDLADVFRDHVSSISLSTAQLFVFIATFTVSGALMWFMISRGLKGAKLSRRMEIADNLGGATLGVVVSAMAVTLAVMLISLLLQVLNQTVGTTDTSSLGSAIAGQIDESALVPLFLDMTPYYTRIIEPWFPNGIPSILK